ncbi:hypothetical protein FACS1894154_04360 [Betaproteobacteria bacterium]|nr:hypothetical protein FACS1894154_04360 [Betaproteobacteria bacterium]GHU28891.1 hypothetical protein FACS189497_05520 [Betaproteobacteria bacterium]
MNIITRLRERLAAPDTGARISGDWPALAHDDTPRRLAAVLVPLVLRADGPTVLLTRRTDHLHHHPGQISFPGGGAEDGDTSVEATALRETQEEIGLEAGHIELIGRLADYFTGTGFRITPVVGLISPPLDLTALEIDRFEVAEVFEVPLTHFLDPANHQRHGIQINGESRHFHAMPYGDYFIWGATAGMLMELYRVVRQGE